MAQNLTIRQQKLVALLKRELLNKNFSKTFADLMVEAGYSPKTAINPSQKTLDKPVIKDAMKDFVDLLGEKAKLATESITPKKLKKSSARDNAYVADIMTKNQQLLSGNDTERKSINIQISEQIAQKNA